MSNKQNSVVYLEQLAHSILSIETMNTALTETPDKLYGHIQYILFDMSLISTSDDQTVTKKS